MKKRAKAKSKPASKKPSKPRKATPTAAPARSVRAGGAIRMRAIGTPDVCRTSGGKIQVTASGTAPNLSGFTGGPEVWAAWNDAVPDPIPMSPALCSSPSLGVATKVQDAGNGFSWGPTSFEFDDPCPDNDLSGALVIYYRYESFGDVHIQVDTAEFTMPCNEIGDC